MVDNEITDHPASLPSPAVFGLPAAGRAIAVRFFMRTGQSVWSVIGATFACHVCREIGLRLEMHLKSMPNYLCISLFIIHFISEDLLFIMVLLRPFNNSSHFGTPLPVDLTSKMSSFDGAWCNFYALTTDLFYFHANSIDPMEKGNCV